MKMARDYGRKIGFEGTFLKEYGLDKDFKMNIEANHATLAMYEILKNGGLPVEINFDSKNRRPSNTYEDLFHASILGMDSFAYGLIKAAAMIEDGRLEKNIDERYASFESELGKKVRNGEATLEELAQKASELKAPSIHVSVLISFVKRAPYKFIERFRKTVK